VDHATRRGFLGVSFHGREHLKVRLDRESLRRVNAVIRQHTRRARSISMSERIRRLNEYLVGWLGYVALAETPSVFEELDQWLRRRATSLPLEGMDARPHTRPHAPEARPSAGDRRSGVLQERSVATSARRSTQYRASRGLYAPEASCSSISTTRSMAARVRIGRCTADQDAVRRVSSGLPQSLLVGLTTALALMVYYPLARLARLLRTVGLRRLADPLPLSFYADLSFATIRNDSLDRFGTTLEKRFTRAEIRQLLEGAQLRDVVVSARPALLARSQASSRCFDPEPMIAVTRTA